MAYLAQQIANAVPLAALYATLSYGYALLFGLTRRPDLAYGALFAFAGQIGLVATDWGWNRLYLILPAALALGAALGFLAALAAGVVVARVIMPPLRHGAPYAGLIGGLAVMILLGETGRLAMESHSLWLPPLLAEPVVFLEEAGFGVTLTRLQLSNSALLLSLILVLEAVRRASRIGRIWQAVSQDPLAARLCGVDADGVMLVAAVMGSAMAGLCGLVATAAYGTMDFGAGLVTGLKVVVIAAAGGHETPWRAAAGAAGVALAETLWSGYGQNLWRDPAILSALVLLLILSRRERAGA